MQLFTIEARVLTVTRQVTAESAGAQITVHTENGAWSARNLSRALDFARGDLGPFLQCAERSNLDWGLRVTVGQAQAVYSNLLPLTHVGDPTSRRESPIAQIRSQWEEGDGPLAALKNAVKIVRAYADRSTRLAA